MADKEELEAVSKLNEYYDSQPKVLSIDTSALSSAMSRRSLMTYIRELYSYRHFMYLHAKHRATADNDEMFLGRLWLLLEPVLRIAMYALVFGLILNTARAIENFLGFLIIGVTFFSMLSKGLTGGSGILQRSRALMRSFKFPRGTLVVSESLRNFLGNLIPAILAVVAAVLFQWGTPLSPYLPLVIPLYILAHFFTTGLMFIVARVTAFVPDARRVIAFVNRGWFYVSGVFFSVDRFVSVPTLQKVMMENPAYLFLTAVRDSAIYGVPTTADTWLRLVLWSFGTLTVGFIFFWRAENRYAHLR